MSPTAPTLWRLVVSKTGLLTPLHRVCSVTARVLDATALDPPTVCSVSMQATRATARRPVWSAHTSMHRQRHVVHVTVRVPVLNVAARLPLNAHPVQLRDLEPTACSHADPTTCCLPASASLVIPTAWEDVTAPRQVTAKHARLCAWTPRAYLLVQRDTKTPRACASPATQSVLPPARDPLPLNVCATALVISYGRTCVAVCPVGTYANSTVCMPCSSLCSSAFGCTGPSATEYIGCSFARENDACVNSCSPMTTRMYDVCMPCYHYCAETFADDCFGCTHSTWRPERVCLRARPTFFPDTTGLCCGMLGCWASQVWRCICICAP
jgi:hypothetical protein